MWCIEIRKKTKKGLIGKRVWHVGVYEKDKQHYTITSNKEDAIRWYTRAQVVGSGAWVALFNGINFNGIDEFVEHEYGLRAEAVKIKK